MRKIKISDPNQKIFFTGDTHFQHKNIVTYCFRPFPTIKDMNRELIQRWNQTVSKKDIVFHLGDFIFHKQNNRHRQLLETEKYLQRLNGHKYLILGNHDKRGTFQSTLWHGVDDMLELKCYKEHTIILCHYPLLVWNKSHYGSFCLHGHSHGTLGTHKDFHNVEDSVTRLLPRINLLDVGVDVWNYTPISYDEVLQQMKEKSWKPLDHHKGEWKT